MTPCVYALFEDTVPRQDYVICTLSGNETDYVRLVLWPPCVTPWPGPLAKTRIPTVSSTDGERVAGRRECCYVVKTMRIRGGGQSALGGGADEGGAEAAITKEKEGDLRECFVSLLENPCR